MAPSFHSNRFPNESTAYRDARNKLLEAAVESMPEIKNRWAGLRAQRSDLSAEGLL